MGEGKTLVVVGGVAGGASAAARLRRLSERAEIILFERGEYISFANCGLPYHIDGVIADREKLLVQTPEAMRARFRVNVRTQTEVKSIDREAREVVAVDLKSGEEVRQRYDAVVLSPGAEPVHPPIPGIDGSRVCTLRNMKDMDRIISLLDDHDPKHAVVVGGGYIGLEMVESLRECGLSVTLIELLDQVMAPADPEMATPLHRELRRHDVELKLGTSVTGFVETADGLDVQCSTGDVVSCGLAILAIGVRPEVWLAREAGLEIGALGGIVVDEHMRTSDPDIYAVGDAVEVRDFVTDAPALIPLAGPANRQGRIAADNISDRPSVYKRTQGTAICKVFDLAIGMTGLSEKQAVRQGISYEKVFVHPASHAGYYPGAKRISMKLLFDPNDGRVLGAQAVGADGVDKRIDVLAMAVRFGLTVYDLEEVELTYAPPYGSAKDPVNYAGFVAANTLRGDVGICHVAEVQQQRDDQLVVDVSDDHEVEVGTIPKAKHIPLNELRERLSELPKEKELLVTCRVGLRGYLGCRILSQNGFRCRNISGGYVTYTDVTG